MADKRRSPQPHSPWQRLLRSFKPGTKAATSRLGRRGERLAARYLKRKGFTILARNVRFPVGELDLVTTDGQRVVFVEVKTRRRACDPASSGQVRRVQQVRICRAARHYLRQQRLAGYTTRFDIIGICWPKGQRPQITHLENAFPWRRAVPLASARIPADWTRARGV